MTRLKMLLSVTTGLGILGIAALFGASLTSGATAGGSFGGRTILTHSDSFVSAEFTDGFAKMNTAGKTIVFDGEQVSVNGRKYAAIDPAVSRIDVHVKRGGIRFVVDGEELAVPIL